ncbi:hypothetical protein ABZ946_37280 [Streptomyces sp. NPDC046324]
MGGKPLHGLRAGGSEEDLVVLADLDCKSQWGWSTFPVSELWGG